MQEKDELNEMEDEYYHSWKEDNKTFLMEEFIELFSDEWTTHCREIFTKMGGND